MTELSGQSIGRYHIIEKLGEGGMAVVYKAFDTRLECDVAVKFIRMERLSPELAEKTLKRFEREAKAVAQLNQPNIVKVTDYGEYQGTPYLVMPLLRGGTLKQRLGKPVPFAEAARLLLPIARALDYTHRRDILHRDVKPSNILLNEEGDPLLSDFGVAKILENTDGNTLTGTGVGVGTPEYMPIEQWHGKACPASDQYSLAVVFYELVTGCKPYAADTPAAILIKQSTDPLPNPRDFVPGLPQEVERILFKALARNPQDRYQDMRAFAQALEKLAVGSVNPPRTWGKVPNLPVFRTPRTPHANPERSVPEQPSHPSKTQKHPHPARLIDRIKNFWVLRIIGILTAVLAVGVWLVWKISAPAPIPSSAVIPAVTVANTLFSPTLSEPTRILPSLTSIPPTASPSSTPEPTKEPEAGSTRIWEKDRMVGMYVPSGIFYMGTENGDVDEKPLHEVFLDGFWIDRTEISVAMYKKCQDEEGCEKITKGFIAYTGNYEKNPVNYANWEQARQYCEWVGRRLPSEAEWEKAARGTDMRTYPWGEGMDCQKADFSICKHPYPPGPAPVDAHSAGASPYGALQMAGNLAEWVADYYDPDFYQTSPKINPVNNETGYTRVVRGGSEIILCNYPNSNCSADYRDLRVATRYSVWPDNIGGNLGFRCAADAQ